MHSILRRILGGSALLLFLSPIGSPIAKSAPVSPPGRTIYVWISPCSGFDIEWSPEPPKRAEGIFDLYGVGGEGTRSVIQQLGGKVIYEFHVPVVRALLPVSALAATGANWARSVEGQDLLDHMVTVILGIPTPLSDSDRQFLEGLGATIIYEWTAVNAVYISVPDESIPAILLHPGVWDLELNIYGCLG
jgi:hypothetical protein